MKARILIVEDDPFFADVLARALGLEGYDVTVANSAGEGVRLGRACRPALVIAAWWLRHDMHGGEVCRRILAAWPGTKIIVTTGHHEFAARAQQYCDGVAAVLLKPFHKEEILRAVRQALIGAAAVLPTLHPLADFRHMALDSVS